VVPAVATGGFLLFLSSFSVQLLLYQKRTAWIALGTVVAAAANIVLNRIFIPKYGYEAAAWTTVASYAVLFLVQSTLSLAAPRELRDCLLRFRVRLIAAAGIVAAAIGISLLYA
jgi:O-antigen/teichoic acid export membrane protein